MPPEENNTETPDLASVIKMVGDLAEGQKNTNALVSQIAQSNQTLTQSFTTMQESLSKGLTINQPEVKPATPELGDDPTMGEVSSFILQHVGTLISDNDKKHAKDLEDISSQLNRSSRTSEIERVRNTDGNEDFNDWLPEMGDLAKVNSGLGVKDLLNLARANNPLKLAKIESDKQALIDAEKKEEPVSEFTGLTPTSSNPASLLDSEGEKEDGNMSMEDALSAAFKETVPKEMLGQLSEGDPMF